MTDAPMRGKRVGGVLIRRSDGTQRRCFCVECENNRASRASEKREWKRELQATDFRPDRF